MRRTIIREIVPIINIWLLVQTIFVLAIPDRYGTMLWTNRCLSWPQCHRSGPEDHDVYKGKSSEDLETV